MNPLIKAIITILLLTTSISLLGISKMNFRADKQYRGFLKNEGYVIARNSKLDSLTRRNNDSAMTKSSSSWVIKINESGYYSLTRDITNNTAETAIIIAADNVILDGNGHLINGSGALSSYGIYIYGRENITILNLTVANWNYAGIYIEDSYNVTIKYTAVENNSGWGVHIYGSSHITLDSVEFYRDGLYISYSSHDISAVETFVNGKPLVLLEGGEKATVDIDAGQVILMDCNNITVENLHFEETDAPIQLIRTNNSVIRNNIMEDIYRSAIRILHSSNNYIINNTIKNSVLDIYSLMQIDYSNNNTIVNNTLIDSSGVGINLVASQNNTFEDNTIMNITQSAFSLWDNSNGNIFTRNLVNLTKYYESVFIYESRDNYFIENTIVPGYADSIYLSIGARSNVFINNSLGNSIRLDSIGNVFINNTVNGEPLIYLEEVNSRVVGEPAGQIVIVNSANISVRHVEISNLRIAIEIYKSINIVVEGSRLEKNNIAIDSRYSVNITIRDNIILDSSFMGVYLQGTNRSLIYSNMFLKNDYGLALWYDSMNNTIFNNTFEDNDIGVDFIESNNNMVYLNNFINNVDNYLNTGNNVFHTPQKVMYIYNMQAHINYLGNYWSDYEGSDADGDGIGDEPYGPDDYPLMGKIGEDILLGDKAPPVIIIVSPKNNTTIYNTTIVVSWIVNDTGAGLDHIELYLDGKAISTSISPETTSYKIENLTYGKHILSLVAYDKAGNKATRKVIFTIEKQERPSGTTQSQIPAFILLIIGIAAIVVSAIILLRKRL